MRFECMDEAYDLRGRRQSCEEQVVNRLITEALDVGAWPTVNGQRKLDAARADVVALINPERRAREADVIAAARAFIVPNTGIDVYREALIALVDAGSALDDADAPGGG